MVQRSDGSEQCSGARYRVVRVTATAGQEVLTDPRYGRFCGALVARGGARGAGRATHIVVNGAVCVPRIVFHSQAQVPTRRRL